MRRPAQFLALLEHLLDDFAPDQLIACNGHPMIFEAMARARARGVTTAFAVRGFGYYEPRYFADVDHAFTCSQFLTDVYREKVGLDQHADRTADRLVDASSRPATPARSSPSSTRAPHKGLLLFARLADMLGSRRPDIPILVVQSGQSGGSLNAIPGIDFGKYPQIMAAPPVPKPADYFALTRILLVPVGVGRAVRPRRGGSDDQRRFRRSSATAEPCRTSSAAISPAAAADACCRFPSG